MVTKISPVLKSLLNRVTGMIKTELKLFICIAAVFLVVLFLWSGKTPFISPETDDPQDSLSYITPPVDPGPVGDQSGVSVLHETESSENATSSEYPHDIAGIDDVHPDDLTAIFPKTACPMELPVEGATGWAAVTIPLYSEADVESDVLSDFKAGQVFAIISETDDFWYVETGDGISGWVEHVACLINLPDVIPSIVYNITNAYSALTRSSGFEIPGVTGEKLYDAWSFNHRLLREEFIVPTLYSTSKMLYEAQQLALKAGDTIIMHEAYRAHESQQRSVRLLKELMKENEEVDDAINDGPWNLNWFIATSLSNHQRGVAFDVNLGKVISHEILHFGEVSFPRITEYEEYIMPTTIHELSPLAVIFERPVSSRSRDAWRDVPPAETMTPGALRLQSYFDGAGFTPLASEWWHFNDLDGADIAAGLGIRGSFFIEDILSVLP